MLLSAGASIEAQTKVRKESSEGSTTEGDF
jgi:hypothetical protein